RYPVLDTVDVLVAGGGSAGAGAAIGAARAGAKTLLIENHSFFGGVAAWALGMQMNQMRPGGKPRSAVHELLISKLTAYGDQAARLGAHEVWTNVEYLKVAILDALDAAGANYLVHMRAVDAIVERNRVAGVVVATKRGLMTIRARCVVDCTGDADVAFYSGAETMTDPDQLMPMTLAVTLSNIDRSKIKPADVDRALRNGRAKHPLITSGFFEIKQVAGGNSWWVNHAGTADMGRIDATDPAARSKAECASRRQALQMIQAIREADNPALQQIEWAAGGPQVSVRETRRVKGAYLVTEEDAMAGRRFDDAIAWRAGFLDTGGQRGGAYTRMKVHDVPYRSILPIGMDGLLVAGRCISATHMGAAAGKSMGNCMATGHAAGIAAAISARTGRAPRELKAGEIQKALRTDGVDLEGPDREQKGLA
ncbi:MAG TPA: FAD-dependent oxidoreductase, partial [Bryobacteraceae bacterium]|nr:FAD-dependent oxidoreductase [Bryobacteraceae bacterium]